MKRYTSLILRKLLLFTVVIASCSKTQHTNAEIIESINNYDSLVIKQDPAAIAQAFTPDGKLGDAATGRAAIQQLFSGINKFKVVELSSVSNTVQIQGDSALQTGTYVQRNVNTNNDTIRVMGTFTCKWRWIEGEGWKIAHIVSRNF